jgi:hypothetical protein
LALVKAFESYGPGGASAREGEVLAYK